jgi:aspartate/methionine/tyrosine aminotransferase
MQVSARAQRIDPFHVMEVSKAAVLRARAIAPGQPRMLFLNIGEPDYPAAPLVQAAAQQAIASGKTQYTDALGLPELRERISAWYASRFGIEVPASRIAVTAGASAALQLACLALVEPGHEVLLPDPCYPCNRQFVQAAGGMATLLPTTAAQRFQLSADQVRNAWRNPTRGVLLATPSNPTGTSIDPVELQGIVQWVEEHGGYSLVDEIYLGLSHDPRFGQSALAHSNQVISVNSFSKYFCMTGWRLGWLVLPQLLVAPVERLAQNLFICPSTVAQRAALACFETDSIAEFERRRADFKARQAMFARGLAQVGLPVPVQPDGAFYVYADCTALAKRLGATGSWDTAFALINQLNIAATPGKDFGNAEPERFLRFSTATAQADLVETLNRLKALNI